MYGTSAPNNEEISSSLPSSTSPQPHSTRIPKRKKFLIFVIPIIGGVIIAINFIVWNYKTKSPLEQSAKIVPLPATISTSSQIANDMAYWKEYQLGYLSLKLPSSWWVEKSENDDQEYYWMSINPSSLKKNIDTPPAFQLYYYPNTPIANVKQQITEKFPIIDNEQVVNMPYGELLEAQSPGGVLNPEMYILHSFLPLMVKVLITLKKLIL